MRARASQAVAADWKARTNEALQTEQATGEQPTRLSEARKSRRQGQGSPLGAGEAEEGLSSKGIDLQRREGSIYRTARPVKTGEGGTEAGEVRGATGGKG